jgi:hypothetical protein
MADDELDSLYWVQPGAFTAQRTKLAAAATQRGDEATAKRISAARKPTTAAWIANRLVLRHKDVKQRLADLGDRLRAAHAAMDGERIRELSAQQHRLIDDLARAAFDAADLKDPSSTLRDDLTSTLQAAIADPEVRTRLGRLARAETWSGFGGFGDAPPAEEPQRGKDAHRQLEKLNAALAAAERAKAETDRVLSDRRAERDAVRQRHDEAVASLRAAERELKRADDRYDKAMQENRAAGESVKMAQAQLKRA